VTISLRALASCGKSMIIVTCADDQWCSPEPRTAGTVSLVTTPCPLVSSPVTSNPARMRSAVSIPVVAVGTAFGLQEAIAVRRAVTIEAQEAAVGRGRCRASERS
jgi:hypothetical protein